jgi:hypothetical protein
VRNPAWGDIPMTCWSRGECRSLTGVTQTGVPMAYEIHSLKTEETE